MKIKAIWRKSFESGGHRPHAALLYMGYVKMPPYFWQDATIYAQWGDRRITAMYAAGDRVLIIYE